MNTWLQCILKVLISIKVYWKASHALWFSGRVVNFWLSSLIWSEPVWCDWQLPRDLLEAPSSFAITIATVTFHLGAVPSPYSPPLVLVPVLGGADVASDTPRVIESCWKLKYHHRAFFFIWTPPSFPWRYAKGVRLQIAVLDILRKTRPISLPFQFYVTLIALHLSKLMSAITEFQRSPQIVPSPPDGACCRRASGWPAWASHPANWYTEPEKERGREVLGTALGLIRTKWERE